jgi:hypothetical protein
MCEIDLIYIQCGHTVITLPRYLYDFNPGQNYKKDLNNQEMSMCIYLRKCLLEV